jgi:two-component system, cell cycle sensor histidine kinase and response regulator CckA
LGTPKYQISQEIVPFGIFSRQSIAMSAEASFPWSSDPVQHTETGFRSIFEQAPMPAACCDAEGRILATNPAFDQVLEWKKLVRSSVRFCDLLPDEGRETAELLLCDLLGGTRASLRFRDDPSRYTSEITDWIVWPAARINGKPSQAVVLSRGNSEAPSPGSDQLQAHRWESVGRLTGGVVHDFNNLLTGVMLYCDLLLASHDADDHQLRRYVREIRTAVAQAGGLVQQLLVFAKPKPPATRALSINDVVETMRSLLLRLIGENVKLEFHLDPALARVEIEQTLLEQLLLNLILNSRDALPRGGRIQVETSNCKFESLSSSSYCSAFPCVLLAVSDNGHGMDATTRQHLFEPFFTTKDSGKGTGLGLTTVRTIVANHRGLIHVDSEPGNGTRIMILLPQCGTQNFPHLASSASNSQATTLQEEKKEPHL